MYDRLTMLCCALLLSLSAVAAAQSEGADETAVRFQATVYEVHMPNAKSVQLDAESLGNQASNAASLLDALGRFGQTKVLNRFDEYVPADEPTAISSNSRACAIGTIMNPNSSTTTINFHWIDFGAEGQIAWRWADPNDRPTIQLSMQWKIEALRAVPIPVDQPIPVTYDVHTSALNFAGIVALSKPIICLSIVNDPREESGSIAYIVHAVVSERAKP